MSRAAVIAAVAVACLVVAAAAVWLLRPGPVPSAPKPLAATTSTVPPLVVQSSSPTSSPSPASASPSPSPSPSSFAGSPWSVVSEYYGDVESGDYQAAWQLLGFDPNGESYAQFVAGYACTGGQTISEIGSSGDQVTFNLTAEDTCLGQQQTYVATDTVQNGKITAADITQLSGPGTG